MKDSRGGEEATARWQRMWSLFHAALERPAPERPAFLEDACADAPTLRQEVESLLKANESDQLGTRPPAELLEWSEASGPAPGDRIGPYRIEQLLGEGGMGIVYAAEQESPLRRPVALKLIKPGMDSREILARFASERQALALMNHPHIARIYDAGVTPDGRPYFAMERVDGVPITDYCQRKQLTIRQRLELFLPLCYAVQHAHQRGIIHRDLKPSNVLVAEGEGGPAPKIIDFGIAKALDQRLGAKTLETRRGDFIGTPEFMSPEQLESPLDVDTRTDVYALGALLYLLVAGAPPYELQPTWTPAEIRRHLYEKGVTPPSRRSTSRRRHRSDRELDWIILKALAWDREQRYGSAAALAADIENYLDQRAVQAAPPGAAYRIRKFVQRHRLGVSIAATALALLAAFAVAMAVQSSRLARALSRAELERKRAEEITSLLVDVFQVSDPWARRGQEISAREVLDQGARRVTESLSGHPELKASLLSAIGHVYGNLGMYAQAEPMLMEALRLRRALYGDLHPDVALSLHELGVLRRDKGDSRQAEPLLREGLAIRRKLLPPLDARIAQSLLALGATLRERNQLAGAEAALREALTIRRSHQPLDRQAEAPILDELANVLRLRGDFGEVSGIYAQALALRRAGGSEMALAETLNNYGSFLLERGELQRAAPLLEEALKLRRLRLGPDHPRSLSALNNLALLFRNQGNLDQAEAMYRESLAIARRRFGGEHAQIAYNLNNLGLVLQDKGELRSAAELFRKALALQRKIWGDRHPNTGFGLTNLARVLHLQKQFAAAEPLYREALELRRSVLPAGHPDLAMTLNWYGKLQADRGRVRQCEPMLREALGIRRMKFAPQDWRTAESESFLCGCLAAQGRFPEAEPLGLQSYASLRKAFGPSDRRVQEARAPMIGPAGSRSLRRSEPLSPVGPSAGTNRSAVRSRRRRTLWRPRLGR